MDDIHVLGAKNVSWDLDNALDADFKSVFISHDQMPIQDCNFKIRGDQTKNNLTDSDYIQLGELYEGYSSSDIELL